MWRVIRENPRAVVYAVLMHVVLLVLLVINLDWTPKPSQPGANQPIQAKLVDQRELDAVQAQKQAEQRRIDAERARQKAEAEKQRKAEVAAQQKAKAEKQRKAEAVVREKAAAEKKRKAEVAAKQKTTAEKKRQAEVKRKAEEERKVAEAALQAQMAAEQQRRQAEQERVSGVVAEYTAYIQEKVNRNWLRPPGVPEGLSCTVKVILIPGGDVANVEIIKSSGNPVFDRSVETAVFRAAPMPLPPDSGLFNYFRDLRFIFKPGS
jgi:colicin import membrane protein